MRDKSKPCKDDFHNMTGNLSFVCECNSRVVLYMYTLVNLVTVPIYAFINRFIFHFFLLTFSSLYVVYLCGNLSSEMIEFSSLVWWDYMSA